MAIRQNKSLENKRRFRFIVSACLAGVNCSFDGKNRYRRLVKRLVDSGQAIAVCPEVLGLSSVPRERCEISGGDGADVLADRAKVLTASGKDITGRMVRGAKRTLSIAKRAGVVEAILKSKSPSCGFGKIYDGKFTGKLITGNGVTSALLSKHKIVIHNEEEMRYAGE